MTPAEDEIHVPKGVNCMVELQCEVAEGNILLWKINGHTYYGGEENIFIDTTENSSVLRFGDAGFDKFGVNELLINCTAFDFTGFTESVVCLIVRFGRC